MEGPEGSGPACPDCGAASGSTGRPLSRRSVLRLGLAAGAGAAAAGVAPAFGASGIGPQPAGSAGSAPPLPRDADGNDPASLPRRTNWPAPAIFTRAQWGCNEALRKPGQSYNSSVEKIVVHHTVTPNNPADPAAVVRSVYQYNVSGEYIDIAYHFLIDHHGRIYEGRWARDYPPGVPHTGEDAHGNNVQGAATLGHNPRTIAVAMLGTFTSVMPTPAAMSSLVAVLAWKCARWGIDPLASTPYTNSDGGREVIPDILGHRTVYATICPGDPIFNDLPLLRHQVDDRLRNGFTGYWIASSSGATIARGDVPDVGDPFRLGVPNVVQDVAAHPSGLGYWALGRDGGIFTFGTAAYFGSTGGKRLNQPIVGMAPTRSGNGYWLVARDGGIFCFGDARFFGSTGAIRLNQPIVGMAPTPSGNGYWLVARDGGVFCFGDARFFGSTGAIHLNQPIIAIAPRPHSDGYWLLARDGGMFCFGSARFFGSGPSRGLRAAAVGITPTTTGEGYAMLAADGSVLAFGDAPNYGGAPGVSGLVGFAGRLVGRS